MINLLNIIKNQAVLYNVNPEDDFPEVGDSSSGGGGAGNPGNNTSGTTSGNIVPGLTINPSTDQSIALGETICFTASGSIFAPSESSGNANLDVGCSATNSGTWIKNCGTNYVLDSEARSSRLIYKNQPFQIQGKNSTFTTPGVPNNNYDAILGAVSTGGYYFYWEVYRYRGTSPGSGGSTQWNAHVRLRYPNGTSLTLSSGRVEFNQTFRIKSDGNRIIWEFTTEGNWAYNHAYFIIPEDAGDFQFMANALFLQNAWTNVTTSKGSYQGIILPEEFVWGTNCTDALVITGDRACYTPTIPGSCSICVSAPTAGPICVDVVASPLYLNPVGIDCGSCGGIVSCLNIPDPTTPVISTNVIDDTITVTWSDSISFTTGLYYQVDVNGVITDVLDSTVILNSLPDGTYNIMVRAVDDCGQSVYSNIEVQVVSTVIPPPVVAFNFSLVQSVSRPLTYTASWDPIAGSVNYEIWSGNSQNVFLTSTTSTSIFLGTLTSGLQVSVRSKDVLNVYTQFSNIEIVP